MLHLIFCARRIWIGLREERDEEPISPDKWIAPPLLRHATKGLYISSLLCVDKKFITPGHLPKRNVKNRVCPWDFNHFHSLSFLRQTGRSYVEALPKLTSDRPQTRTARARALWLHAAARAFLKLDWIPLGPCTSVVIFHYTGSSKIYFDLKNGSLTTTIIKLFAKIVWNQRYLSLRSALKLTSCHMITGIDGDGQGQKITE